MTHASRLPEAVQYCLSIASTILLLITSTVYIIAIIKRKVNPRPLSWLGWVLIMGTSLIAQIIKYDWQWNQIGLLFSTLSCLTISVLAFRNGKIFKDDWICLALGMVCLIIYLSTKNALLTTVAGILADFICGIPTLQNAYRYGSEKSNAWYFSTASWSLTIINCTGYDVVYYLFPVYLFLYVGSLALMNHRKPKHI